MIKPIKVVIAGAGSAGWMTAAYLAKQLGSNTKITLVEPSNIGTIGVGEATIPPIRYFNKALQLNEAEFVRRTNATFKLGIEFENWGTKGNQYIHVFGEVGRRIGAAHFHHYYLRARAAGYNIRLDNYSLNAHACWQKRFSTARRLPGTSFPGLTYAYHFDSTLYADLMRDYSLALGVTRILGTIESVETDQNIGNISRLHLSDGVIVDGDFFIDCTGFRSLLLGEALGVDYVSFDHWLPCDRAITVQSEIDEEIPPFTRSVAERAGWRWQIPLQHRIGNGHVFSSGYMSDDEATARLLEGLAGRPLTEPRTIRFNTGRRHRFWEKNCVAIGLASGFIEPIESTGLHLIQALVERLATLFPRSVETDDLQQLASEFNRRSIAEFDEARDFVILHYHLNERSDSDFWRHCSAMSVPEEVTRRVSLFANRGTLFPESNELFTARSWLNVMLGQNVKPKTYSQSADDLSESQMLDTLNALESAMSEAVSRLPRHASVFAGEQ